MERFLNIHYILGVNLVIIAIVVAFSAFINHKINNDLRVGILANIDRQEILLAELATVTDRNGADTITESIIIDCPRRTEFENLLGVLGNSSHLKLLDTQQLFESCGGFYSERKALMVSRLNREYQILEDNVLLLKKLDSSTEEDFKLAGWRRLVEMEQKRSDLLQEQLEIQQNIITLLIAGNSVNSKNVVDAAGRAGGVNESLIVLDQQIDIARDELAK